MRTPPPLARPTHPRPGRAILVLLGCCGACASPANPSAAQLDSSSAALGPALDAPASASPAGEPGASGDTPRDNGTLSVSFANDLFAKSDGNFSNGVAFLWTSNEVDPEAPDSFLASCLDFWSFLPLVGDASTRSHVSFALGQTMSTATDISLADPPLTEQPYAGLLAASTAIHTRTESSLHNWWFLLGIVGPSSYAEETQKAIHQVTGSEPPQGWDTQLSDEPVLNIYYDWRHRLSPDTPAEAWGADLISTTGGGVGNAWLGAFAGVVGRCGYNLPDNYGPSVPRAGLGAAPVQVQPRSSAWQAYGFVGVDGQWVGRNIFLDGNNWTDSRSVESEPWVGALSAGLNVHKGRFGLTFAVYSLTDTYETQVENNSFGLIALTFRL